ncbi:MAG: hypothetical protein KDA61_07665 [Planctomycetales bacterium]|nr:hypothetical protein [Planctomycetales bacterium]
MSAGLSQGRPADPGLAQDVTFTPSTPDFVDRRVANESPVGRERRQFTNSYGELSPEAGELAAAIDQYKMRHRRRFINYEEMLAIIKSLGYQR